MAAGGIATIIDLAAFAGELAPIILISAAKSVLVTFTAGGSGLGTDMAIYATEMTSAEVFPAHNWAVITLFNNDPPRTYANSPLGVQQGSGGSTNGGIGGTIPATTSSNSAH